MFRILVYCLLSLVALSHSSSSGATALSSLVFGQIAIDGLPLRWRLVVEEVDTGKLERITLERREATGVLFDFATPLPPGKYRLFALTSPQMDGEYRIAEKKDYFELKSGAVLYLGNWQVMPSGDGTRYSVKYDMSEVGLFARANPSIDPSRFAVGVLGKAAVPLKTQ